MQRESVAIVTGSSTGNGFETSLLLAKNGFFTYATMRNLNKSTRIKEIAKNENLPLEVLELDVTNDKSVANTIDIIGNRHQRIDVLVNNAGTFIQGNVSNEPDGALEQMLEVNLFSAYHTTRALLPKMMEEKNGHIFTMCSIASLAAYPNGGAYSISKYALLGFTKNLRRELMPYNIKVTAIIPGAVYTDSWKDSGVAESRIMEAEDIAMMIYATSRLSPQATVEEILMRPQLGDL